MISQHNVPASKDQNPEPLTNDTLKAMLVNMGYEPKPLTKDYLLVVKQASWTINSQIVISGN